MAIVTGQLPSGSVSNTTVAPLVLVPPGPCTVVLSNVSGVTVYVASVPPGSTAPGATAVTASGFAIPTGAPPVTVPGSAGSAASQLYLLAAASGATGSVSWLVSSTN